MTENHRGVWRRSLETIRLFFQSESRCLAIGWCTLLVSLLLCTNGLNVVNSYVGRDFMTAIADRQWNGFVRYAIMYVAVFGASTLVGGFYRFSEERLRLLWRGWLTNLLIGRYMSQNTFYRLKARNELDNPDERITEDVKSYTASTLSFFLLTQSAVVTSLAFLGVLWSITPKLVLVAILYAAAGTGMTILLGRPLVRLNNRQLQREADLRYHLIQTRETAETISAMGAARLVRDCLRTRLDSVIDNNKRIITVTRNLSFFTSGYNYLIQIIPALLVAPMYMRGEVDFGVVTQSAMAFSAFLGAFSLIVTQFEMLSAFAAVTNRLNTIGEAIEHARAGPASPIEIVAQAEGVEFQALSLWTPRDHNILINELTLSIPHGTNLLITGSEATAETALFLACAGLWENGKGKITRPESSAMAFVPQQPLSVGCSIRDQMLDSMTKPKPSDDEILAALEKVGLREKLERQGGLDAEANAADLLSHGEHRLLIVARVLLAAPRFVFLDRIGGDLNTEQLADMYRSFQSESISYISIGEAHTLLPFHDSVLEIKDEGKWQTYPAHSQNAAASDGHIPPHLVADGAGNPV